jgi:hypothetical protein
VCEGAVERKNLVFIWKEPGSEDEGGQKCPLWAKEGGQQRGCGSGFIDLEIHSVVIPHPIFY